MVRAVIGNNNKVEGAIWEEQTDAQKGLAPWGLQATSVRWYHADPFFQGDGFLSREPWDRCLGLLCCVAVMICFSLFADASQTIALNRSASAMKLTFGSGDGLSTCLIIVIKTWMPDLHGVIASRGIVMVKVLLTEAEKLIEAMIYPACLLPVRMRS